jgi:hypothetical protein
LPTDSYTLRNLRQPEGFLNPELNSSAWQAFLIHL